MVIKKNVFQSGLGRKDIFSLLALAFFYSQLLISYKNKMKTKYKKIYVYQPLIYIDEFSEREYQTGAAVPFEYALGAYYEMDTYQMGEIANIMRLLGTLPPQEAAAIRKTLKDDKLNAAERKAKERGIQKLRNLLLRD